ncbi:MAG: CocE/NonD family hydrolase [Actinomycetota bacterium]
MRRSLATLAALTLLATACSGDDDDATPPAGAGDVADPIATITEPATFTAAGSVRGAYVLDADPGAELALVDREDHVVATGTADDLGSVVFYDAAPGDGYTVRHVDGDVVAGTEMFAVLGEVAPDESLYDQTLVEGLNYVRVRDGVEIAMTVRMPTGQSMADAPFPTVIEYSGYQIAAPKNLLDDVVARLGNPSLPADPLVPSTSTAVGSLVAPAIGYAVVSVQMRGTGCSGGAFDLFDYPTIYDGYDAVEVVAAQDWVQGNTVGMVGLSFSGLTQLFTAGTRPPHLAAVTPLSVTDDLYATVGSPGGIYNRGFAQSWLEDRTEEAKPAPEGGQPWARELVAQGDEHCIANQRLHGQARDVFTILNENPARTPDLYDRREPGRWAAQIEVPVFAASAFQDEQIIGLGPQVVAGLLDDNDDAWITLMNGTHVDPLGPGSITRWAEFLGLFVADEVPVVPQAVLDLGGALYQQIANAPAVAISQTRFAGRDIDLEAARAEFRTDPRVRVVMDIGGGPAGPGALEPVWTIEGDSWPPAGVEATSYFFDVNGALVQGAPAIPNVEQYTSDASARNESSLPDGDPWHAQPPYEWQPVADGKGLGYVSAPLTDDVVIAGPASADLRLTSTAPDTDIQVTLSEVRPDGQENYVQFGVLRASYRALDDRSNSLEAIPTFAPGDRDNLVPGESTLVRVPIYPVAYAFRAGSRIRLTIQAPGGDRPRWLFDTAEDGSTENTITSSEATPSALVLPVLTGQTAGGPLPACGALRGTPCRAYVAAANGG